MANIIDYIAWRGDLTFEQAPPCPVDFLVLAQLVHAPLELCGGEAGTLRSLDGQVWPSPPGREENALVHSRFALWNAARLSARFGSMRLAAFASRFDAQQEKQFAAAMFELAPGVAAVCYRGTDATLVGWKEDLNMSFESPVPSQRDAVAFLEAAAGMAETLYTCGHSKGGNLAIYACAHCAPRARRAVRAAYSFDGPGLDEETLASASYTEISARAKCYIPESSIIGLLMGYKDDSVVVRSDSVSLMQHNPYRWHVLGPDFVRADGLTHTSRFADKTLHSFLSECPARERQAVVDTLYNVLAASGASTLGELPRGLATHVNEVAAALRATPPENREAMARAIRILRGAGGENTRELLAGIEDRLGRLRERLEELRALHPKKPGDGGNGAAQ